MTLPDDVREALRSELQKQERVEETPWGLVVSDRRFPKVWDANFVQVERDVALAEPEAAARALAEEVGGDTAVIYLPDLDATPRTDREARAAGWEVDEDVLMVLRGAPSPLPEKAGAVRVEELPYDEPELQRTQWTFRRLGANDQEYGDDVFRQLLDRDAMLAAKGARWFAGFLDGRLAGYCDVSTAPNGVTYVDNVVTGEPYRRRGVASAVVTEALRAARRAGGTDAYLYAGEGGPAAGIYERIGFRVTGRAPSFMLRLR